MQIPQVLHIMTSKLFILRIILSNEINVQNTDIKLLIAKFLKSKKMNKNTGVLLSDIRNNKRNTTLFASSQDIITSAKQLKKIKSSKQINLNTFMENKNQKIKNIDQKLELHETQIQKNNKVIQGLSEQFFMIKEQFSKQKERTQIQQRKNKLLKEQIQRSNKLLRAKTIKVDQLNKTNQNMEKQMQAYKAVARKNEEYTKTISTLRGQIATLEEAASQAEKRFYDQQKEFQKVKQKISESDTLRAQIDRLNAQISAKDSIINNYKLSIHEYSIEKDKDISQKLNIQKQFGIMSTQFDQLKRSKQAAERQYVNSQKRLSEVTKKLQALQSEKNMIHTKAKNHETEQNRARSQLHELKQKYEEMIGQFNQRVTQCNIQGAKIQKATQKIKQLELKVCEYKAQKDKLVQIQGRFSQLKLKGNSLQSIYNEMLPQIQCPYGHQLKQTVTIIPCGHNYCLGCKKGYQKQCSQCKGKLKIEAVYRNQLMDDIIGIITNIKQVIDLVK